MIKYYIVEVDKYSPHEAKELGRDKRAFRIAEILDDLSEAIEQLGMFRKKYPAADWRIVMEMGV